MLESRLNQARCTHAATTDRRHGLLLKIRKRAECAGALRGRAKEYQLHVTRFKKCTATLKRLKRNASTPQTDAVLKKYSDPQLRASLQGGKIESYTKSAPAEQKCPTIKVKICQPARIANPQKAAPKYDKQQRTISSSIPALMSNFKLEERTSELRRFEK